MIEILTVHNKYTISRHNEVGPTHWKMLNVHHMYNKCTTLISHGVGPTGLTHCGAHLI
jgi:hypothetical protein